MAATNFETPALSAVISPVQRLAWPIAGSSSPDVAACMLRLFAVLTSRAQIEACEPSRRAGTAVGKSITRKMRLRPRSAPPNTTTSLRPLLLSKSGKATAKLRPHDPEFWTVISELSTPISVSRPELEATESDFAGVLDVVFGRSRNSWP